MPRAQGWRFCRGVFLFGGGGRQFAHGGTFGKVSNRSTQGEVYELMVVVVRSYSYVGGCLQGYSTTKVHKSKQLFS